MCSYINYGAAILTNILLHCHANTENLMDIMIYDMIGIFNDVLFRKLYPNNAYKKYNSLHSLGRSSKVIQDFGDKSQIELF